MGLYGRWIVPRLTDWSMSTEQVAAERQRVVPRATGTVLEIGAGTGLNLPFYDRAVERLQALEPSREMWALAARRAAAVSFPVEAVTASAEAIPLGDRSVDTVVTTFTLCSIPDPLRALGEMRRVLRPAGRLLFVEHGRSLDGRIAAWQDRLNRPWRALSGGCNLNREIDDLVVKAGFQLREIERGYGEGPRPMVYLYRGIAQRTA
jgi:ubiquinone/menaquinone biosynthesis C-methylase UbiE